MEQLKLRDYHSSSGRTNGLILMAKFRLFFLEFARRSSSRILLYPPERTFVSQIDRIRRVPGPEVV
jgi:hypothetical protein